MSIGNVGITYIEGLQACRWAGFAGWKYTRRKSNPRAKQDDGRDKPEGTKEEDDWFAAEAGGNHIDKYIKHFAFKKSKGRPPRAPRRPIMVDL